MEEIGDHLILPKNDIFGGLYVVVKTKQESKKIANSLMKEHGVVAVPGEQFYGGVVKGIRLSLVSVPWTERDEDWVESVRVLKKALT